MTITKGTLNALLSEDDLSAMTGMTKNFFAKCRLNGTGPEFIKVGRYVRYEKTAVEAWLASRTFKSTAEAERAEKASA